MNGHGHKPNRQSQPQRGNFSNPQKPTDPIPYGFRPIKTKAPVLDAPMWRDGASQEERYSGELLLSLTALTPCVVGNQQQKLDKTRSVLVPQMLDDGRVLIAGSGLKGMLRTALADLLQAPMDKVSEHHYTYRPNLAFARDNPKREFRAAIVERIEGNWPHAQVTIKLLPPDTTVDFVHNKAEPFLPQTKPGQKVEQAKSLSLTEKILTAYQRTQEILADAHIGHLSPGHPLNIRLNQLIYVEIEHDSVTSMGHHFQYRWAYTSSVQRKNRLLDGQGELRAELALHQEETADENGAPQHLTGARLLFGYAVEGRNKEHKRLAEGNFKRLAGRISFNTAIEAPGDKSLEQRFVDGGEEVQLRVLGTPRPSAVELYLKQDNLPRTLRTYGDQIDDAGGELAGRKYYRHQPDTREKKNRNLYSPTHAENGNTNNTERGTLVRYLSRENSKFLCTLRFDSLRLWELGAMLAALEPRRIEECCKLSPHKEGYAHKLGYGKPLGLGSVRFKIDGARWHKNDDWAWQHSTDQQKGLDWQQLCTDAVKQLQDKLESTLGNDFAQHRDAWLKARRWKMQGQASYPTKGAASILAFHNELRRDHAQARRSSSQKGNHAILKELKDLLEKE